MAKYSIDAIDQKILVCLIGSARMPFLEIARECGISGAAIHQRVKKLEEAGIIIGSRLEIDPKALGNDVCAYVSIELAKSCLYADVIKSLESVPEIVECNFMTGEYSLLVKLYCRDNKHLMDTMIHIIKEIPGVANTQTLISLEQSFERQVSIPRTDKK